MFLILILTFAVVYIQCCPNLPSEPSNMAPGRFRFVFGGYDSWEGRTQHFFFFFWILGSTDGLEL